LIFSNAARIAFGLSIVALIVSGCAFSRCRRILIRSEAALGAHKALDSVCVRLIPASAASDAVALSLSRRVVPSRTSCGVAGPCSRRAHSSRTDKAFEQSWFWRVLARIAGDAFALSLRRLVMARRANGGRLGSCCGCKASTWGWNACVETRPAKVGVEAPFWADLACVACAALVAIVSWDASPCALPTRLAGGGAESASFTGLRH
jgi:hypothetical protein